MIFKLLYQKNVGSRKWEVMRKINSNINDDIVPFSVADMEFKNLPEIIEVLKKHKYIKTIIDKIYTIGYYFK